MITKINIDASKIDTEERYQKIQDVAFEIHTVLNSTIFRDLVMKMKKHGERSKYKDYSNAEIYQILMKGAETLDPVEDYEWDIYIDDYFSLKRVIGYTKRNIKTIFVNTRFFDTRHRALCGSNIVHEQSHKLGFSHDFRSTKDRPFSVSYQLNICYEKAFSKIYNIYPEVKVICRRSWKYLWLKKICTREEIWPEY